MVAPVYTAYTAFTVYTAFTAYTSFTAYTAYKVPYMPTILYYITIWSSIAKIKRMMGFRSNML